MAPKIDLGPLNDRDLLVMAVNGVNELNEKVDLMGKVDEAHGLALAANTQAISLQKQRCDSVQGCPPVPNSYWTTPRKVVVAGALGGGLLAVIVEVVRLVLVR